MNQYKYFIRFEHMKTGNQLYHEEWYSADTKEEARAMVMGYIYWSATKAPFFKATEIKLIDAIEA